MPPPVNPGAPGSDQAGPRSLALRSLALTSEGVGGAVSIYRAEACLLPSVAVLGSAPKPLLAFLVIAGALLSIWMSALFFLEILA